MKTLTNVRTYVRSLLDETTAADWTNAELNRLINNRYHRVITAVINVYEDYYLTTDTFDSVEDQEEYGSSDGAPTDVFKVRRVELNYDVSSSSGAPTRCLPISTIDAVRRDLSYTNTGIGLQVYSNAHYYIYGYGSNFKIGFIPKPDKDGTNAIKIWYIKEVSDLSSDSDQLDIPYADRYWNLIAEGATGDALRFGQQDNDSADKFDIKFEQGLGIMQQELEDRVAEESKSVIDVTGEILDFM